MNILIVDDVDLNRTMLSEMLKSQGYETTEAEDGIDALKVLGEKKVGVIISDLLMPRMDGLRLCAEVRRRQETRNIPFIIYTGTLTTPNDEELARGYGADLFIRKPAAMEAMLKSLESVHTLHGPNHDSPVHPSNEIEKTSEYSDLLVKKLEDRNFELESLLNAQNGELERILGKIQQLYGLLPICPSCKKSRVDEAYWAHVRAFVEDLPAPPSETLGFCDECGRAIED